MIPLGVLASAYVAPAGGSFTPADLTLFAWFDAADTTTIAETGGSVTAWADKAGNVTSLTPPATKPTTGVTTRNSLNVIDFATSRLIGVNSEWTFLHDGTEVLIGLAFTPNAAATGTVVDSGGIGTGGTGTGFTFLNTGSFLNRSKNAGATVMSHSSGAGTSPVGWQVVTALIDPDNATASARSAIWINGSGPYATNTSTAAPSTGIGGTPTVGSEPNGATGLVGKIGELVFALSSSTADRAALESHLMTKWGISA